MSSIEPRVQPEQSADELRKKARLGVVTLALRTVLVQLAVLGGNVFLFRLLQPAEFGAFSIVQFALSFLLYFGDAGLGGALIQKREEPSARELSSVFYLQLAVALSIVALVGVAAPFLMRFWPDMPSGALLLRTLSLQLLLTALRVVPAILMERELQYLRLAVLDVVLSVSFYAAAVTLAKLGFGVMALVGAAMIQGTLGVVAVFIMRPWRPRGVFDWSAVRPLLRFGVLFQAKNLLGFATGAVQPVYAGHRFGQRTLGLISWAQSTAFFPLQLVAIISRVNFPLYSRLHSQPKVFADVLARSVQLTGMATLLFCGIVGGLGPRLVSVLFTDKWLEAMPLLYVYLVGISLGFLAPVVSTALDAGGRADFTFRFSLVITVLIWTVVPLASHFYGVLGFVVSFCVIMWLGNMVMIWLCRTITPEARLVRPLLASVCSALASVAAGVAVRPWVQGPFTLIAGIVVLALVFAGVIALLDFEALKTARSLILRRPTVVR